MNNRIFVRLRIISCSITPEELTNHIGIECEHSWRIGDKRGKTKIIETTNGWLLSSGISESASLDEHIRRLFERIAPVSDRISDLADRVTTEISCVIYSEHAPELFFTAGLIQLFTGINAGLDIDLYMMDEKNEG